MDIISNMLITIKNGTRSHKDFVAIPYSKFKHAIAKALLDHGLIKGFEQKKRKNGDILEIELLYVDGNSKIQDIKRISKPSRRLYASVKDIYPVREGHGRVFLSTPKGILDGTQAQKELVGGELLFEIW